MMASNKMTHTSRGVDRGGHAKSSFPMSQRLSRQVWKVCSILITVSPRPFHAWRRFVLRCFGAKLHSTARIYPGVRIWHPAQLIMHAKSCLAERVEVYNPALVEIGEGATISQGTWLCTASHDFDDPEHPLVTAPINIHRGAWLAGDVFVGPGVTVGDEAVALARAVLVKDVGPSDVVGGNPAKVLRKRALP
jgi:putative colanic acid biosynthesis acetyltransferase WcaF